MPLTGYGSIQRVATGSFVSASGGYGTHSRGKDWIESELERVAAYFGIDHPTFL